MTQLLILSCIAIVVLAALLVVQARGVAAEREEWKNERRFLIDRAIAQHVGEVIALEREDARKSKSRGEEAVPRPLLEGLS
jgi:hypothetical protein